MKKIIHESGRRKRAVARATLKEGTGKIKINNIPVELFGNEINRMRISEPLMLAGDILKKINIKVKVAGGGLAGQANAVRIALSKTLVGYDKKLKSIFEEYDRRLLIADVRFKETRKPNTHSKARAKRQKSYR